MSRSDLVPDPPDISELDVSMLSVSELREWHEKLGRWLAQAESAPLATAPDDDVVEEIRTALVEISRERAERQGDERAPRGG